jgi:hypothetical protein
MTKSMLPKLRKLCLPLVVAGLAAAPAAAQQRVPDAQRPMSPAPPAYGQDAVSSGIPERVAALRAAVPEALRSGAIDAPEAERLALTLARLEQRLQYHNVRSYHERLRLRRQLDGIEARLHGGRAA